ncbi:MAG: type II and III secretion system protein [Moorea sp. SIO2B7]|nr:type II and III secretion system protein [Moorena sp. SIO2B7]
MTFTEDFVPDDGQDLEGSEYPTAFGITVTPMVGGIICGIIGIVGAGYLLMTQVLPAQQSYKELLTTKQEKEAVLEKEKTSDSQKQIKKLEAELKQVEQLKPKILELFSKEEGLDTLLLDLYGFVKSKRASLISFEPEKPDQKEGPIIKDGSLGTLVDGKLKRQNIELEFEGTFAQIQAILQKIEQQQSLLLIKDFKSEVTEEPTYLFNIKERKVETKGQTKLKTTFILEVILPLSNEELEKEAAKTQEEKKK